MTTAWLDHIDTGRIGERARQARVATALLRLVAILFFTLGFVAAKALGALWFALAWCAFAVAEGWTAGRETHARK
jgi:hypothetical protein